MFALCISSQLGIAWGFPIGLEFSLANICIYNNHITVTILLIGFNPHSGRRVVSLSKTYLPPKSTGNTQEAMAPSQHD